jgi:hypothetical protein
MLQIIKSARAAKLNYQLDDELVRAVSAASELK